MDKENVLVMGPYKFGKGLKEKEVISFTMNGIRYMPEKKEEPKLECDHIVALREVMSVICLPLSKLKELSDLHKKDGTWEEIFYWLGEEECTSRECPLCCEKLDWEAIEKQLNT